jgi:hypothetical protein
MLAGQSNSRELGETRRLYTRPGPPRTGRAAGFVNTPIFIVRARLKAEIVKGSRQCCGAAPATDIGAARGVTVAAVLHDDYRNAPDHLADSGLARNKSSALDTPLGGGGGADRGDDADFSTAAPPPRSSRIGFRSFMWACPM